MTVPLPMPRQATHDVGAFAQPRRVAAELARCQILLRLVSAKIEVLTAGATLEDADTGTWLALRPVAGGVPPVVDLADLLREERDPELVWEQVRRLTGLQEALREYVHELGG